MTEPRYPQKRDDACELEMNVGRPANKVMKKLLFFVGVGFLIVVFGGAIIALISKVLVFAIVGFAVWIPIDVWMNEKNSLWHKGIRKFRKWTAETKQQVMQPTAMGGQLHRGVIFLTPYVLEALCGAGVACLLVYLAHPNPSESVSSWIIASVAGGGLGFLIALAHYQPEATNPDHANNTAEKK